MRTTPHTTPRRTNARPHCAPIVAALTASIALTQADAAHASPCDLEDLFDPPVAYAAGDVPRAVVIGDLDGDGDGDLVVGNQFDSNANVLLNNGDGTFTAGQTFIVLEGAFGLSLGDVDGDGDLDLAVASLFSGLLLVFSNDGSANFQSLAAPYVEAGQMPAVALEDMNGDARLDLVSTNATDNDVKVRLSTSALDFPPDTPQAFSTGLSAFRLDIEDLDGDGDLDIAVVNRNANTLSVLLNDGSGGFAPPVNYATIPSPVGLTIEDLDNDGDRDIAVVASGSDQVQVLLNAGDGTFPTTTQYPSGLSVARNVSAGDFDNDGDIDLVAVGGGFTLLPNNGDGTFAPPVFYSLPTSPTGSGFAWSVAVDDLDDDGDLDLALTDETADTVTIFLNRCIRRVEIDSQPVPALLFPAGGGFAELSVSAQGTHLEYQWRKDGVPLTDGGNISGATTPNLTVFATLDDVGAYDVVVSNVTGQIISDTSVIAVRASACPTDSNNDGVTDLQDLLALLAEFGNACP